MVHHHSEYRPGSGATLGGRSFRGQLAKIKLDFAGEKYAKGLIILSEKKDNLPEFLPFLYTCLEIIDSQLASESFPIQGRPFRASWQFVNDYVVSINGEKPGEFMKQSWFRELFNQVKEWYRSRHGSKIDEEGFSSITGVAHIFNDPFEICIPLLLVGSLSAEETRKIIYPESVFENENPLDWLSTPPNFDGMDMQAKQELSGQIRATGKNLRAIHHNIRRSIFADPIQRQLAKSITSQLDTIARNILSEEPTLHNGVVWEAFFAFEISLKSLLNCHNQDFLKNHDLNGLLQCCYQQGMEAIDDSLIENFPTSKTALAHRYRELEPPNKGQLCDLYFLTLKLVNHSTSFFVLSPITKDLELTVRVLPPWQKP